MIVEKFIKKYVKRNKKAIILYVVATLLLWLIGMCLPFISGNFIDALVSRKSMNSVFIFTGFVIALNIINILVQYFVALSSTKVNNLMLFEINSDIFKKLRFTPLSKLQYIDIAYFMDRINSDSSTVVSFFSANVSNFFLQIGTIILSLIFVFRVDFLLGICIILLLPIYIFIYKNFKQKIYDANYILKDKNNEYFSRRSEQVSKIGFIKRNIVFLEMNKRLEDAFKSMYRVAIKQVKISYLFSNLNNIIVVIVYVFVIFYGGMRVLQDQISIGYFTILNTYFTMIISSITYFLNLTNSYQQSKISVERINDILDEDDEDNGTVKIDSFESIRLENVQISLVDNIIFSNLNYTFETGKIYGLSGKNGIGKTTLLNILMGMYNDKFQGDIFYNSYSIRQIDMHYLRQKFIAYIEQEPVFINLSLKDYFQFGITENEKNIEIMNKLLDDFNLCDIVDQLPNGMDSLIIENGNNFSGGEKQKIALIRMLIKSAKVLLFDEPSSALDINSTESLMKILNEEKDDKIIIIISHDQKLLLECDEVVVLTENGIECNNSNKR